MFHSTSKYYTPPLSPLLAPLSACRRSFSGGASYAKAMQEGDKKVGGGISILKFLCIKAILMKHSLKVKTKHQIR
jgi:hypothetical protein